MIGSTRRAGRHHAAAITSFRQTQYRRSPDLTVADESVLVWDEGDDASVVLAVWGSAGELLATMRAELLTTAEDVERSLDCPVPIADARFPVIVLGRAATHEAFERIGLNSLLRLHLLAIAKASGIRLVFGRVYDEAPRTRLMKVLGYEFLPHPKGAGESAGTAGVHSPLFVAVLDLEQHGETAISTLKHRCGTLLAEFPMCETLTTPKPREPVLSKIRLT